jgi:septum formation protein
LAISKANSVACRLDYPALVIGCDTVADLDGEALGKPRDRDDAQRMLRMLSGRRHSVWSGLCLIDSLDQRRWADRAESQLVMTELSEQDLQAYLDSQAWKGKSGAFGFQDGPSWLTLVSGTAENVVGLPIDLLNQLIVKASGSR